jgi:integrase
MIAGGLARGVINQRVGRIKRVFRWALSEELVPEPAYRALLAVDGLKAGRSPAREPDKVRPVPDAHVEVVLPHLSTPLRAMVQLQRLTGMRSGEVAQMRTRDVDAGGDVWRYTPRPA